MGFQVVCISRTIGAGGEAIGQAVSGRLGFRYIDEEILAKAAEKAQVDPAVVAAAEHKQPFIKRLIDALAAAPGMPDPSGFATAMTLEVYYRPGVTPPPPVPEDYRALIRESIREVANEGRAVIVAHAASLALAGTPGILRVLVTASPEVRAQRLMAAHGLKDSVATAAVKDSDRERRDYFRLFYHLKEEQPTNYDLVINTDVLGPEEVVRLVVAAAQS